MLVSATTRVLRLRQMPDDYGREISLWVRLHRVDCPEVSSQ